MKLKIGFGSFLVSGAAAVLSAGACANDDVALPHVTDAGPNDAAVVDTGTAVDAAKPLDAGSNSANSTILINEISGGNEWIELVNSGKSAFNLSGYQVADRDKTTFAPKLSEGIVFPENTVLAAGSYLIVRGGGSGVPSGPGLDAGVSDAAADATADAGSPSDASSQSDASSATGKACPVGPWAYCFHAKFGISNKDGDTLFLLAPDASVAGKVVYPANASSGTFTYSRVPDGIAASSFKTIMQTPGSANIE